MKKIDSFINLYPLSKTLQFSLIPIGETLENFEQRQLLLQDEKRAENYQKVKKYIDRYHKYYIESVLVKTQLTNVDEYAQLYSKREKTPEDAKLLIAIEGNLRGQISKKFQTDDRFGLIFKKEMITQLLPSFLTDSGEKESCDEFKAFTTYFTGFFENRKNMYSSEEKLTAIAYRCINENLPKFLDNVRAFISVSEKLPVEDLAEVNKSFESINGMRVEDAFTVDYFSYVLAQSGIDNYNQMIGGYTHSDGRKIKGLNEYINLYNQKIGKAERLPKLKFLFKQILSDSESFSYIPEAFKTDDEVLAAINKFYNDKDDNRKSFNDAVTSAVALADALTSYDSDGVYVAGGLAITDLSNGVLGSWSAIQSAWNDKYDIGKKQPKDFEKYKEKRRNAYKSIGSFSIHELQDLCDAAVINATVNRSVIDFLANTIKNASALVRDKYSAAEKLLTGGYSGTKKLYTDDVSVALIKDLLDSIKSLEFALKPLNGSGKEAEKDDVFYGDFASIYDSVSCIDKLYDKVRNYMTQKPYSKDKIKLNFDNPQFLGGWDKNKEGDYRCVLLRKSGMYYLAVMEKGNTKLFLTAPKSEDENYEKIEYKLLPGPNKMLPKVFFAKSNINFFEPSSEIMHIYNGGSFKKGVNFNLADCHKLIDFYKASLAKHRDWCEYNFSFRPTAEYNDVGEFYNDVKTQGYKMSFRNVSQKYIDDAINSGNLYLFQIYNKDFSPSSKGAPNLHTLYFKMLFDERNLSNVVYQLNGGAEMFYRKASIGEKEQIIHPAGQPITNKKPHTNKASSTFEYDLVKDKRFTKPQFSLHLPITLNFKSAGKTRINDEVRAAVKSSSNNYVIGIDRGERNLIYVCVVDESGKIVEQFSLNEIINSYNGRDHKTDYHALLDQKEAERKSARQNWNAVESIKELKEGYISQVVHKICELVVKYDAVIAMEDLNSGFKNSRVKVEKQVYQKFEKMLIDKLNYLVEKKADPASNGGLLNAYQLTNAFDGFKRMGLQNGFIFYIPAWLTSKIDPATGFADLLKPRYVSVDAAKDFISRFSKIEYNTADKVFEFSFNYADFSKGRIDYTGCWTVCSNGTRVRTFRNIDKNSQWDSQEVNMTDEFVSFFKKHGIDYCAQGLKDALLKGDGKEFYHEFLSLVALMLQMRNSVTGTDIDYLISPVRSSSGVFYDSRDFSDASELPANADANGAYNIARKLQWALEKMKNASDDELRGLKISISNKEWLEYAQKSK